MITADIRSNSASEIADELHARLLESAFAVSSTRAAIFVEDLLELVFVADIDSQEVVLTLKMPPEAYDRACSDENVRNELLKTGVNGMRYLAARSFYEHNYKVVFERHFNIGKQEFLEGSDQQTCRFCGLRTPAVSFIKKAHALPESVGNKKLFTKYECDSCNQHFGSGIEREFGLWSNWQRTMFQVEGKYGIPEFSMKDWHVKVLNDLTEIKAPDKEKARFNEEKTELNLEVPSADHIPVAVLKAFNKMALCLIEEGDIEDFRDVIEWIRDPKHTVAQKHYSTVFQTFLPEHDFSGGHVILLRRINNDLQKPYMIFILSFGNLCYQLVLPPPVGKQNHAVTFTPYFFLYAEGKDVSGMTSSWVELSSCEKRQESRAMTFRIFNFKEGQTADT